MVDSPSNTNIIETFRRDFQRIKEMGFVRSNRAHNTGVGKTFEDLIGVPENNFQLVDYMDFLELKSQRDYTGSMLTLFTKSPDFPQNANTHLRDTYGTQDEENPSLKKLHTTASGSRYNSVYDRFGLKLECDNSVNKIFLRFKNLNNNTVLPDNIHYNYATLRHIVEQKCQNIAYINAETRIVEGHEQFKYNSAVLLTGLSFDRFINLVNQGLILYDIRIGSYKSGANFGKIHDHGSGFRVKKADIERVFTISNIS